MILPILLWAGEAARAETTLLDFYADWCVPCQAMASTVDTLARDGYAVQRVNVDQDRDLAVQFGVTAIPCFVVVERGTEVDRIVGHTTVERLKVKLRRRPVRVEASGNANQPHPAWRYQQPVGYRAATVRIYCQDDARTRSIGSGVLVHWGIRTVVLTARHVVQDAKKIIVELSTKRTHYARVLTVDAVWDCAVLELVGQPQDVVPAEVEVGEVAMQKEGNRLESCGYGPDGKLACNSGLFLGYKRSTQTKNGPDDWMEMSGHARPGDSGGPIFNEQSHVVGVLWGTDGQHVIGVQAGRIHQLLDEAVAVRIEQKAFVLLNILERKPTPPRNGPSTYVQPLVPMPAMPNDVATDESLTRVTCRKPQSPQVVVQPDPEVRKSLGAIDAKVGSLVEQRQAEQQATTEKAKAEKDEEASPLVAGLCILGAVAAGFVVYFVTQK
jgi:thioredoxin 1